MRYLDNPVISGISAYQPMAMEKARQYGVDPSLVIDAIGAESGWDPNAVSPVGAKGLMQIMDPTAGDLGLTDSFDPTKNVDAGVRYIKQQLEAFGGDKAKAMAAYNAGSGRVRSLVKQYGDQWQAHLPAETKGYLKKLKLAGGVVQNAGLPGRTGPLPGGPPLPGAPAGPTGPTGLNYRELMKDPAFMFNIASGIGNAGPKTAPMTALGMGLSGATGAAQQQQQQQTQGGRGTSNNVAEYEYLRSIGVPHEQSLALSWTGANGMKGGGGGGGGAAPRVSMELSTARQVFPELPNDAARIAALRTAGKPKATGGPAQGGSVRERMSDKSRASATREVWALRDMALGRGTPGEPGYQRGAFSGNSTGVFGRGASALAGAYNELTQDDTLGAEYEKAKRSRGPMIANLLGHVSQLSDRDISDSLKSLPSAFFMGGEDDESTWLPDSEALARRVFDSMVFAVEPEEAMRRGIVPDMDILSRWGITDPGKFPYLGDSRALAPAELGEPLVLPPEDDPDGLFSGAAP